MRSGHFVLAMGLMTLMFAVGTAGALYAEFVPDHIIVESHGYAVLRISGADESTDALLTFTATGVVVEIPSVVQLEPDRSTTLNVGFELEGSEEGPVDVYVWTPGGDAHAGILVTTSTQEGIDVVAVPKDFDGDEAKEDVEIYVHERDNEDVAIPNASIAIDGESIGRTDDKGMLRANDFEDGNHTVTAEWADWSDETSFRATEPPIRTLVISVFVTNLSGHEYDDAIIYVNFSQNGALSPVWGARIWIDNTTDFLGDTRSTDITGRIVAKNIPIGAHMVSADWDGGRVHGYRRFYSFGNLSPEWIVLDAVPFSTDATFLNDVRIVAMNALAPIAGMTLKVPTIDTVLIGTTDGSGAVEFFDLEKGWYGAELHDNDTIIARASFRSEGTDPFFITVTPEPADNDGDGYHDDLIVHVEDPHGVVPGATVWLDGIRIGRTDPDGILSFEDLPAGDHGVRGVFGPFQSNATFTSYGTPTVDIWQEIKEVVKSPGSDLSWNVFYTRPVIAQQLLGTLTITVRSVEGPVDVKQVPVDLGVFVTFSQATVVVKVPSETGEYTIETNLRTGELLIELDPVHFFVYHRDILVDVQAEDAYPYGEDMVFNVRLFNDNPAKAVIFDPLHLQSNLFREVLLVDFQTWDGNLVVLDPGEEVETTVSYSGGRNLYLPGHYRLEVMGSPFSHDNVTFQVVQPASDSPQVISHADVVTYTAMSLSVMMVCVGLFRFEVSRIPLLALFIPLYTRMRRDDVLDHFLRGRIFEYIKVNPGVNFSEILRYFDLNNGTLTYHLNVLEREKYVKSIRDGVYRRYYLAGTHVEEEHLSDVKHRILQVIHDFPGISQSNIAKLIGASRRLVNYHIKALESQEVIEITREGRNSHIYLRKELDLE
ncbi:MAG: winged helix-turn-helix transcriptional regulator [Thermoplasmata archaeon]|nr:winged helix-turn-helix transcriptional regulator [Thermoplasmata archaeon]